MNKKFIEKLNIVCIGFDWDNIGRGDYGLTKKKFDRDGLNTSVNDFFVLYAGMANRRDELNGETKFLVRHVRLFSKIRFFYDLFFIVYLPFILKKEKVKLDLFYLYDFPHILAAYWPAKKYKAKIYLRLINLPTELALTKGVKGKIFYCYYKLIEKITYKIVDRYIVINETTKKYLLNLGVSEKKIVFDIPNTIERDKIFIEQADKIAIRKHFNIAEDKKIIISIGSLIKEKGFVDLIEAFVKLKRDDLVLIICGQGKEKNSLKKLVQELGADDKIIFAGQVSRENIWHYLSGADIFMLFSKSESLGMVFWEAMYMNLPVIGTPVGGVIETIGLDGDRGFFWKNDLDDLNKKIDFCLTKSEDREITIKKAREYVVEKFKIRKNINEIFY
jgi:glycosyltransferase involved in cell wall biosynthesis